jgi:sulfite reductase beta subunit-like hemoprotein
VRAGILAELGFSAQRTAGVRSVAACGAPACASGLAMAVVAAQSAKNGTRMLACSLRQGRTSVSARTVVVAVKRQPAYPQRATGSEAVTSRFRLLL